MRDGAPCTSLVARTSRGGAAARSCPTSRVHLVREDGKRTSRVIAGWGGKGMGYSILSISKYSLLHS